MLRYLTGLALCAATTAPLISAQDAHFYAAPEDAAAQVLPDYIDARGAGGVLLVLKDGRSRVPERIRPRGHRTRHDLLSEHGVSRSRVDPRSLASSGRELDERGQLYLDEPIHEVLPHFRELDPPILVEDLFNGNSGIRRLETLLYVRSRGEEGEWFRERALALLGEQRGHLEKHTGWKPASGRGTDSMILAATMEAATKRSLSELLDEYVFQEHDLLAAECLRGDDTRPVDAASPGPPRSIRFFTGPRRT